MRVVFCLSVTKLFCLVWFVFRFVVFFCTAYIFIDLFIDAENFIAVWFVVWSARQMEGFLLRDVIGQLEDGADIQC
jgi:hypothetical protein